ncbi:hypothetical protein [Beijerinckia indica]|uniref:Uncharacterized protein n=1 Tax=Beijerinckia indica subsp. indica (strain ATCC 9039 / DSM 1715 / NCIMB 8712) TaxID=395963 RepID=B2ILA3_BEII9|nr:hypothetical protein [Beijerinckia indica]ACB97303.1 hypothetical protein Bind_3753 [Beijerinckia indica subsp. indica ATCC 9039]
MTAPRTRTKSALKEFLADEEDVPVFDQRATEFASHIVVDGSLLDSIREIFAGTPVATDDVRLQQILDVRAEVQKNWSDARDSFLSIGRALLSLESILSKLEYQKLRYGTDRIFPFSDATATQFRQIARAVDSGRIPYDRCPGSYGTAYQITLLDDYQLKVANERDLIRPNVTRREISLLRQEIKYQAATPGRIDRSVLQEERNNLRKKQQRLQIELEQVATRLSELESLLGDITAE